MGSSWNAFTRKALLHDFFFFSLCDCVVVFRVECLKYQKIHWLGLEKLCLFKVESDRLEAFQDPGQSDFKVIGVHTTSLLM